MLAASHGAGRPIQLVHVFAAPDPLFLRLAVSMHPGSLPNSLRASASPSSLGEGSEGCGPQAVSASIPFGDLSDGCLTTAGLGARRNEDIALDLLKFVSVTAGVGRPAAPSTGFSGASAPKPEEHVSQLLELYSRCLKAVEGKGPENGAARS